MLFRKMLRDMKWNKMQFISIFLLAFLGIYVYSGIGGETAGVRDIRNEINTKSNLSKVWIYGENFNVSDLEAIRKIEGITGASRRIYLTVVGEGEKAPSIYMHITEDNVINKPEIVEGEDYDPKDNKRVWLDKRFATANNISVGEPYTFDLKGMKLTLEVGGLFYSAEYTYYSNDGAMVPDFSKVGIAFASYTVISQLLEKAQEDEFANQIPFNQIVITTNKEDVSSLEEEVSESLMGRYSYFLTRESMASVNQLKDEMKQHESMMIIFSVAFVAIAILAIITTMNRLVSNQRIQIGTLKALGVKKSKIARHYVSYGFWLSSLGALLGVCIGPITLPKLFFSAMSSTYTLKEWRGGYDASFFIVAVLVVLACTLTTYLSCIKVLHVNPVETLKPAAPKAGRKSIFEILPFWERLSFAVQYNLRDFSRSKVRCLMGFAGTLCCMALLVCAASMYDSFSNMSTWNNQDIENFDNKVALVGDTKLEQAQELAEALQGELIMEDTCIVRANGVKKIIMLTAAEGKGLFRITDSKMNIKVLKENDFAITQKTAKALMLSEGDTIEWHLIDSQEWITSTVTIINRIPMGVGITTTRDVVEKANYIFTPSYIATNTPVEQINSTLVKKVNTKEEMIKQWNRSMETMNVLVAVLIVGAALLALLILYNLGLLAYTERERELATLKVMGFRAAKLRRLLLIQNTWLSVLGILLGTPAGIWMVQHMVDVMGDAFDMIALITFSSFIKCAIGTLLVSVIVSFMFSGKLKRINMVGALKNME